MVARGSVEVFAVLVRDFSLLLIAFVKVEAIAECNALASRDGEVAGGFIGQIIEIMQAKGVGGKKTVIAHMPPGRVPRVSGMIENGNADNFALYRSKVIAPIRSLAPGIVVAQAGAGDDVALTGIALETHGFGDPHCHSSFLGIAQSERPLGGMHRDFEIENPLVWLRRGIHSEEAVIGADQLA